MNGGVNLKKLIVGTFVCLTFLLTACTNTQAPKIEPTPYKESIKSYFPLTLGSSWQYLGEGNEYASFSRKVLFVKDNKAQVIEDNGGTVIASIFEATDTEITRIFFKGEQYSETNLLDKEPNTNLVILKAPIKVGTKWNTKDESREIVAVDASVETTAGKFDNCVKISIPSKNDTMYEYYKKGIGLVKREFISKGMTVTSTLEKYDIKD